MKNNRTYHKIQQNSIPVGYVCPLADSTCFSSHQMSAPWGGSSTVRWCYVSGRSEAKPEGPCILMSLGDGGGLVQ